MCKRQAASQGPGTQRDLRAPSRNRVCRYGWKPLAARRGEVTPKGASGSERKVREGALPAWAQTIAPPQRCDWLRALVRQAEDVWSDAERQEFVDYIARNPEAGDLIPDTSGVRKVRWRRQGMGKRGGVRVIYFYHNPATPLFLLMVYAKAVREDVAPDAKKALAEFAARIKRAARG